MVERRPRRDGQRRVVHAGRHRADVGVLSPLAALLGGRRAGHLVAKLPSPDRRCARAAPPRTRPRSASTATSRRTVAVRAPACSCAVVSDDGRSFVLLLEDMAPAEQGDQIAGCTLEQAHAAVVNLAGLHGPRWCDESLHAIPGLAPFGAEAAEGMGIGFGMMVEPFIERYGTPDDDADVCARSHRTSHAWMTGSAGSLRARARRLPPRQPHVRDRRPAGRRAPRSTGSSSPSAFPRATSGSSSAPACRTTSARGTSAPSLPRTTTRSSRTVSARTHRSSVGTTTGSACSRARSSPCSARCTRPAPSAVTRCSSR